MTLNAAPASARHKYNQAKLAAKKRAAGVDPNFPVEYKNSREAWVQMQGGMKTLTHARARQRMTRFEKTQDFTLLPETWGGRKRMMELIGLEKK